MDPNGRVMNYPIPTRLDELIPPASWECCQQSPPREPKSFPVPSQGFCPPATVESATPHPMHDLTEGPLSSEPPVGLAYDCGKLFTFQFCFLFSAGADSKSIP